MAAKQVACDCGATIRKPNEQELIEAVQRHAKSVHNMDLTKEQVLSMAEVVASDA